MGIISFSTEPKDHWDVAGWVMRQLLDDAWSLDPSDPELLEVIESAKLYDGLSLEDLPPSSAEKLARRIESVAEGVLQGTVRSGLEEQTYGNAETQAQYKLSLRDLLPRIQTRHYMTATKDS
jgi:hypothetical protein